MKSVRGIAREAAGRRAQMRQTAQGAMGQKIEAVRTRSVWSVARAAARRRAQVRREVVAARQEAVRQKIETVRIVCGGGYGT